MITAVNVGTSILAIEGTQHCLHAATCREANPLLGSARAQTYPIKMALGVGIPMIANYYWGKRDEEERRLGIHHGRWRAALRTAAPMLVNVVDGLTALLH